MRRLWGIVCGLVATLLIVGSAHAATYKPTRFDDPEPGKCKPTNCSLREAITKANNHDGRDKVVLSKGKYRIELPDEGDDNNTDGDFDVVDEATIVGKGARKTTVDGASVDGVFALLTFSDHSIKDLTITRGNDPSEGGGIVIGPSEATITDVVVKKSTAPQGGGLYSVSTDLTITRSTFAGNTATEGGGIKIPAGFVGVPTGVIRDSTISGNEAQVGGGLLVDGTEDFAGFDDLPVLSAVNSTVAGNQASADGGGVAAIEGATVALDNTSVGFNVANSDGSAGGSGGGIFQSTAAVFEVGDSVLASNSFGAGGSDQQCSGAFTGAGNVINATAGCTSFNNANNSIPATLIAQGLASNGGSTKTMALPQGSPAIGYAMSCPNRDQRGEKRPADCDAGSFERKPNDP